MSTIKLSGKDLDEAIDEGKVVHVEPCRWGTDQTYVFERDGRHYMFSMRYHSEDGRQEEEAEAVECVAREGAKPMSDKIWLVRTGRYSDQSIAGAFSTEAKADAYAAALNGPAKYTPRGCDDAWVDEYDVDIEYVPEGLTGWEVAISLGGDVLTVEPRGKLVRSRTLVTAAGVFVDCFARDAEHASKIATEKRQEETARAALRP